MVPSTIAIIPDPIRSSGYPASPRQRFVPRLQDSGEIMGENIPKTWGNAPCTKANPPNPAPSECLMQSTSVIAKAIDSPRSGLASSSKPAFQKCLRLKPWYQSLSYKNCEFPPICSQRVPSEGQVQTIFGCFNSDFFPRLNRILNLTIPSICLLTRLTCRKALPPPNTSSEQSRMTPS